MENNDEYYVEKIKKRKKLFSDKTVIVILVVVILATAIICSFLYFGKSSSYEKAFFDIKGQTVMYVGESTDILVKLIGSSDSIKKSTTSYYADSDDVISVLSSDFYGKSGSITVTPLAEGEDDIHIYTTIGAQSNTKTIATEKIHVIVCPKFDENLLEEKEIVIKKGSSQSVSVSFANDKCSEIVSYSSDDDSIVSINGDAIITAVSTGTTNINIFNGVSTITLPVKVID